jgi:glycosyltransferase involved in cell wall biosynthesis
LARLAIVSTHPIQYNAPLFKLLAASSYIKVKVFYTWSQSVNGAKYDPGFGKKIEWDIPLLEGYEYTFVNNTSKQPGTHHFKGIINPTLNNEISNWQPDAVLIYGWSFVSHLKCIRHFHNKIPVLFRGDSTLLDEKPGLKKTIRRFFLKWVYSKIDFALYTGTNNKEYFLKHGVANRKLIYCPHAIDNDRFFDKDGNYLKAAAQMKAELGFDADSLVLLFAGKIEAKKNPLFILSLADKIKDERLKFLFVGNGALEKQVKDKAEVDKRIKFIDFCNQSQMPTVYRMADVFILPSTGPGETWGLAANEAMASGIAVMLSTKVGGAIDLVQENENGITFSPFDLDKCIDFISRRLANKSDLNKMKTASQQRIGQFTYQQTVKAIENLLKSLKNG